MRIDDSGICILLNNRDLEGMKHLFEAYYRPLVLWSDSLLGDMQAAEDVVQEFFIRIWEQELYKNFVPGTIKSYLYTAVKNISLNRNRIHDPLKRAYDISQVDKPWEEYDNCTDKLFRKVEEAIGDLPPRSREIVRQIYIGGKRYQDVADELGISLSTVKTLLRKSLGQLRQNLDVSVPAILTLMMWRSDNK